MHITHLVHDCLPATHAGGISKIVLQLAVAEASLGHEVDVFTLETTPAPAIEQFDGVSIRRFRPSGPQSFGYSSDLSKALRSSTSRDVLHCHNPFLALNTLARRAARDSRAKYFLNPHGALDPLLIGGMTRKALKKRLYIQLVEKRNLRHAEAVFVPTDLEREWILQLEPASQVIVVPNGIVAPGVASAQSATAFRREFRLTDGPVLLYIGRIVPKKGLTAVITAYATLRESYPETMLLLAGNRLDDTKYVQALERQIADYALSENIRWLDFLDEQAKLAAYANADIFIHASISEGMPMAVLEAMAAGVPCVVTPGTMMHGAAKLNAVVEVEPNALAGALQHVIEHPTERRDMARRALALCEQVYSWTEVAKRVCAAYESDSQTKTVTD